MKIKKMSPAPSTTRLLTFLLVFLASPSQTFAQETALVPPQPINIEGAEIPGVATEGLHIIRYTVKADGSTDNIEFVGGFTTPFAPQFLTESIEAWTFSPGTENGEAVDFHNQEYIIKATLSDSLGISPEIQEEFDDISALVAAGDYRRAERNINRQLRNGVISRFDFALMNELLTSVYMAQSKHFAALETSKLATMNRVNLAGEREFMLTPEILEQALRKRFLLAVSVRQHAEAQRTFELLDEHFDIPANDPITEQAASAIEAINSPDPMGLITKITDNTWSYQPARRIFTVTDVDGRLNRINVRCERNNMEIDFEEGVDWTLPSSLGKCVLDFVGRNDTQFTVYEFAE